MFSDTLDTIERDGFVARIVGDKISDNPRDWDNLTTMVDWHKDYVLGGRKATDQEREALQRGGEALLWRYLRRNEGAVAMAMLSLLDHSGLHMWVGSGSHWSDSAGWDSGTVGFSYITKNRMKDFFGAEDYKPDDFSGTLEEWLQNQIEQDVKTFDQYLTGDVYGIIIEDKDGEEIDSCWGFYGFDYAKQEAEEMLTSAVTISN